MFDSLLKRLKYKFSKELVFEDKLSKILDTNLIMERDACVYLVGERKINGIKMLKVIVRNSLQKMDC